MVSVFLTGLIGLIIDKLFPKLPELWEIKMFINENGVTFLWKPLLPTKCYQAFDAVVSPKHIRLLPNAMK